MSTKSSMRKPQAAVIVLFLLFHAAPTSGQPQGVREEIPPNPSHFGNPHIDCLAVTVLEVNDDGTAKVRVEEVLRGTSRKGVVRAVFTNVARDEVPRAGEKILLFGGVNETEKTLYQGGPIFRFSDKNREQALQILAPPDRTGPLQLGAFFLILAMSVIGRFLLRRLRSESLSPRQRRWLRHLSKAVAFVAVGVYAFYESGICGYCNIRVDLLLIAPALVVCAVVFFSSLKTGKREVRQFQRSTPPPEEVPSVR